MAATVRFTTHDLELMPDDGKRYEVIDGELYVSKALSLDHQYTAGEAFAHLREWSRQTGAGTVYFGPGVIFAEDDDAIPDVVWVARERLPSIIGEDGKLHAAPDLVVEVLSPGWSNEQRDREAKLKLYSRRGVLEYWILDRQRRQAEVYRQEDGRLRLLQTLRAEQTLESPLLPGFACRVADLFMPV